MSRRVLLASVVLFALACACPAMSFRTFSFNFNMDAVDHRHSGVRSFLGFDALVLGPFVVLVGCPAWLANPGLLIGWFLVLARRIRAARIVFSLVIVLALSTLMLFIWEVPGNEAGTYVMSLQSLGSGFYLWLASMILAVLATVIPSAVRLEDQSPSLP